MNRYEVYEIHEIAARDEQKISDPKIQIYLQETKTIFNFDDHLFSKRLKVYRTLSNVLDKLDLDKILNYLKKESEN